MPNNYFKFKQFTIQQDKCAMKVGTDGVLLGAWVKTPASGHLLDVGTGTGLIALMLAQRTRHSGVDAVELDSLAALQAEANVLASPWADRVRIIHTAFQEFRAEGLRYELIVSNPPFFSNSLHASAHERTLARHHVGLSLEALFAGAVSLLTETGRFALVYPYAQWAQLEARGRANGLFVQRLCSVQPTPEKQAGRILVEFGRYQTSVVSENLVVEQYGRHRYSEAYRELCRDFYLNF